MRWSCLFIALAGCRESISLGAECVRGGCEEKPALAPAADASEADTDASWPPSVAPDAAQPPTGFPAFENPSFEITGGAKVGGSISLLVVHVSPWRSCSPPGFGPAVYPWGDSRVDESSLPRASEVLLPSEGATLLALSPDGTTVTQNLVPPLAAGTRYAFMIDIASRAGAPEVALEVWGSRGCLSADRLAVTLPGPPGAWRSVCVAFTPEEAHPSIQLAATAAGSPLEESRSALLFVDNLRADPRCK